MKLALRILVVIAISAFVGATVFLVHRWIRFGFDIPPNLFGVYQSAFVVAALASLLLVPLLLLVEKLAPSGIRGGIVMGASLLSSVLLATLALTQWKQFTLDLVELVRRAWNVYLYFVAFGLAYGATWILLVKNSAALHAMRHKATCPSCGAKIARRRLYSEVTIYYRCHGCGARMRVSFGGWLATLAAMALVAGCYFLYRDGLFSRHVSIALMIVIVGMVTWLFPYILPMQLASSKKQA
jgi:ribosomal protein L37AE/L43A